MTGVKGENTAVPALRLRREHAASAEVFMAHLIGMTYKGLPVCNIADGRPTATRVRAEKVFELLGPPTHYFLGSTDPCWLLSDEEFNRFKVEAKLTPPSEADAGSDDCQPPGGGWLSPNRVVAAVHHHQQRGGGMLTQNIVLS